jgi:predicted kinase
MTAQRPSLYLTCGLPGSGKTTLARRLERERRALRLTGDEWLHTLHPALSGAELDVDALRGPVERLQWETALRVLTIGCDVVLDFGVVTRKERDRCRAGARDVGARVVLCLLDPPLDELWDRLSRRNGDLPVGAFGCSRDELPASSRFFERPTDEELSLFDAVHPASQAGPKSGLESL